MKQKKQPSIKKTKSETKNLGKEPLKIDQKLTLLAVGVVLVFLSGLVYFKKTSFEYQNNLEKTKSHQVSQIEEEEYRKLLDSIKPDQEASKQVFKQIISEEEVKAQIEADLGAKRNIAQPTVQDKDIRISNLSGKDAVVEYFKTYAPLVNELNAQVFPTASKGFQGSTSADLSSSLAKTEIYIANLKAISVPRELVGFHKSELLTAYSNKALLEQALNYNLGKNNAPWQEVHKQFVIADKQIAIADTEFNKVDNKYQIKSIAIGEPESRFASVKGFFEIKEAKALLGAGDTVVVVGNIPDQIKDGVKQAFASAYAKYSTKFLDSLIGKIDESFRIANYAYYSDELQIDYVSKYLAKYSNHVDQEIVKRFIPQLTCGKNQNASLRPIFQAQAQRYLGFNPSDIDTNDPEFEIKMAKVGDFLANPSGDGFKAKYEAQAEYYESEAEKAVTRELLGNGIKSPRSLIDNQISASLNVIEGSQLAALIAQMQLGSVNAENIVSQIVTSTLDQLASKFVFKGAVFQERNTCTPIPVLKPVIPADAAEYRSPDFNPNSNSTLRGQP